MDPVLKACLGTSNIIVRRSNQDLRAAIDYVRRIGELESVLPGIDARKNHHYPTGGESSHTIDAAFGGQRLAIEIDGRQLHGDGRFEFARWRQNAIVLDGWRVLRFTWRMIENDPGR